MALPVATFRVRSPRQSASFTCSRRSRVPRSNVGLMTGAMASSARMPSARASRVSRSSRDVSRPPRPIASASRPIRL
jgi:hypothetical protein